VPAEIQSGLERVSGLLGGPISGLRQLSGGASKETWRFQAGATPLILRRSPGGAAISNAVPLATEAALIRAAAGAQVPVPAVVRVCDPADGLGEAYIMSCVEGETLGRRIVRDGGLATVRAGLARRCGEVIAAIHSIPTVGLPHLETTDAIGVLDRYHGIYRELGAKRPVLEAAFPWLRSRAPVLTHPVLVHGDFRNGNLMIDPGKGLAAVLDWELAHIGDPIEDLGWICVNSWRFGGGAPVGGFGQYDDLLEGYQRAGGGRVSLQDLLFWQAVGSLKWGVMCLMMHASYARGHDLSVERAMIGRRTSATEADLVYLMEQQR
jgi:aminoglycoside phosphotransferase (APT) family kinase protein